MKAIKIDTTKYTDEQILAFAQYRGYQAQINEQTEEDITDEEGNVTGTRTINTMIENPQTPEAYVEERAKEVMSQWFSELMIQEARRTARQAEQDSITSIQEQVGATIEVIEV